MSFRISFSLIIIIICVGSVISQENKAIQPYTKNPMYWQYNGSPSLLLGASNNDNLFQSTQMEREVNLLKSIGGNYLRCTMSSRDSGDVFPYEKNSDGKYDLQQFNLVYWERFETFLSLTALKDIVVQIELWATYDFYGDVWNNNPYNPANNINYDKENSGLDIVHNYKAWERINPLFQSVPALNNNTQLLRIQQKFIDKILEASFQYNNILYSIDNETNTHPEWGKYWANYIKSKADKINKQIYVTEMWDNWDPTGGNVLGTRKIQTINDHPYLYRSTPLNTIDHPEIYNFVDISNHNGQIGQVHYETGLWVRNYLAENNIIRPINNVKIYGGPRNEDWCRDNKEGIERFWRNIFAGHAAVRFHRPPSGIGLNADAQKQIKSARMFLERFDIFQSHPDFEYRLLSDRDDDEAYLTFALNRQYAILFPDKGSVKLDLETKGNYQVDWLNIEVVDWVKSYISKDVVQLQLKTPENGKNWIVLVQKIE